eukprot:EG_transcript_19474
MVLKRKLRSSPVAAMAAPTSGPSEGDAEADGVAPGRKRPREDASEAATPHEPQAPSLVPTDAVVYVVDLKALVNTIVRSAFEGVVSAEHAFHFTRAVVTFADRKAAKAAFRQDTAAWHGCPLVPKRPQGTFQQGQRVYGPTECFVNLGTGKAHVARLLAKAASPAAVHGRFRTATNELEVLFGSPEDAQAAFAAGPITVLGGVLLTPAESRPLPPPSAGSVSEKGPVTSKRPEPARGGDAPAHSAGNSQAKPKGKRPKKRHAQRHQRRRSKK